MTDKKRKMQIDREIDLLHSSLDDLLDRLGTTPFEAIALEDLEEIFETLRVRRALLRDPILVKEFAKDPYIRNDYGYFGA